jgi:hypothetical protein
MILYECETWSQTLREEHILRMFENRELRRIFGPKRDEVIGGWRKLRNSELHNLYFSTSIIRIIKSRRVRWAGHIARLGRRGMHIGFLWESRKEDLDVGGRIILRWILKRENGMYGRD